MSPADITEESDVEDEPPLLQYSRINSKLPPNFFSRDTISSVHFTENHFIFGTHSGILYFTNTSFDDLKTFKFHRSSVVCITSTADESYFSSASIDGTVIIGKISDPLHTSTAYDFKRPVNSVVLDKNYEKTKTFISGGMAGELILSQRNWLGNRIDHVVNKKNMNGSILGIFYVNDVIVWVNETGVEFFDIYAKVVLLKLAFPLTEYDKNFRPDVYKPQLQILESDRFVVSWCDHVWIVKIPSNTSSNNNYASILSSAASSLILQSEKTVELISHFQIDAIIAGIASFNDDQIVIVGFEKSETASSRTSTPPELRIIDISTGNEIHSDEVVTKSFQKLAINDYQFAQHTNSDDGITEFYLFSPSDAINIKKSALKDYYNWYIDNGLYMKAWEIGAYLAGPTERLEIGLLYINDLLETERWPVVAEQIEHIFASSINDTSKDDNEFMDMMIDKWGEYILKLVNEGQLDLTLDKIPVETRLHQGIYDSVVDHCIVNKNLKGLSFCILNWPFNIYDSKDLEERLESIITSNDTMKSEFRSILINVYLKKDKYSKALHHMLINKDVKALDLLLEHEMLVQFTDCLTDIVLLPFDNNVKSLVNCPLYEVELRASAVINILTASRFTITPQTIVELLTTPSELQVIQFLYLKALSMIDTSLTYSFEDNLVKLYLMFEKNRLLEFLEENTNYDIEKAINILLQRGDMHNELIYLWGKIGETKKALSLIIDKLKSPKAAIEFVNKWGDDDLWNFMIEYSIDKPEFVRALLTVPKTSGQTHIEVIKGMPNEMEIEDLQSILKTILKENMLTKTVSENVFNIVDDETTKHVKEYLELCYRGKYFAKNEEVQS